jgi:hypothetical protein
MSTTFDPTFAEVLSEAFSNCGIRPQLVTQEHIDEAIRSANYALVKFSNRGVKQYSLSYRTLTLNPASASYVLPEDVIDVWAATTLRDGAETPIWPISRTDYLTIPKKTNTGRPYNYFFDKGATGTNQRTIYLWPMPDRTTDVLNYWALTRHTDVTDLSSVGPMAYEWLDAYANEIAVRMALKYAPDRLAGLTTLAEQSFQLAYSANRERAPVRFKMRGYIKPRAAH